MRPKVKFLTAVWGEAYIARFAELALPSFLAPGNLPALAAGSELEVVIMTRRSDIAMFEEHAAFRRLREICSARFVEIDDLIVNAVYGFTLTLAYARAIIACGAEMLNTHFVFMNADFVLADGSLRSLLKHIVAGRSIVLGPSFRAVAEALEPRLQALVEESGGDLVMQPRQMAGLALAHPHATTIAKTVNQGFCHSVQPNQFFWQVDEQTLLGRYYLIFMLCLKPERIITKINSYCDYAFIAEMCPSGDEVVMGDSDEFFMLELQQRDQEMGLLRLGRAPEREIAASLASWTTAEHRRAAGHDVVFHAADVPPGIETAKAEARAFVGRIGRMLGRPLPHIGHWHWTGAVRVYRERRSALGQSGSPPELAELPRGFWLRRVLSRSDSNVRSFFRRLLEEHIPLLTPLNPSWLDCLHLRETLESILSVPGAQLLLIREESELVDSLVRPGASVRFATPRDILHRGGLQPLAGMPERYTNVLIYLERKDLRQLSRLVAHCRVLLADARTGCHVFIHHRRGEYESSNFSWELIQNMDGIMGRSLQITEMTLVGGSLKRFNRKLFNRFGAHYHQFGYAALLWIVPALAISMPFVLLTNLYLRRHQPGDRFVTYCSSMAYRSGAGISVPVRGSRTSSQPEQARQSAEVASQ